MSWKNCPLFISIRPISSKILSLTIIRLLWNDCNRAPLARERVAREFWVFCTVACFGPHAPKWSPSSSNGDNGSGGTPHAIYRILSAACGSSRKINGLCSEFSRRYHAYELNFLSEPRSARCVCEWGQLFQQNLPLWGWTKRVHKACGTVEAWHHGGGGGVMLVELRVLVRCWMVCNCQKQKLKY